MAIMDDSNKVDDVNSFIHPSLQSNLKHLSGI